MRSCRLFAMAISWVGICCTAVDAQNFNLQDNPKSQHQNPPEVLTHDYLFQCIDTAAQQKDIRKQYAQLMELRDLLMTSLALRAQSSENERTQEEMCNAGIARIDQQLGLLLPEVRALKLAEMNRRARNHLQELTRNLKMERSSLAMQRWELYAFHERRISQPPRYAQSDSSLALQWASQFLSE